jgi:hypothetical protein
MPFGQSFLVSMAAKTGAKWLYKQANPEATDAEIKMVGLGVSLGVGALTAAATIDAVGGFATVAENIPDAIDVVGSLLSESAGDSALVGAGGGGVAAVVGDVQFGSTPGAVVAEFPDGTTVENPNTDAQGQKYKTPGDYYKGKDPHV